MKEVEGKQFHLIRINDLFIPKYSFVPKINNGFPVFRLFFLILKLLHHRYEAKLIKT